MAEAYLGYKIRVVTTHSQEYDGVVVSINQRDQAVTLNNGKIQVSVSFK